MIRRLGPWAGIVGPFGFLAISFSMATLRSGVIEAQGWASWPSSMAVGGIIGAPQIFAFLWLGGCYVVFALQGIRPRLARSAAAIVVWSGFLIIAGGDVLLAFPTDGPRAPGVSPSWHGILHATGVIVATLGTLVAVAGVTIATRADARWRIWRWLGAPVAVVGVVIGALGGLSLGWAKVVYVLGITLPVPLMAWLIVQQDKREPQPELEADL